MTNFFKVALEGYSSQGGAWPNNMTFGDLILPLWLQQAQDWAVLHGTGRGETEEQLCAL